MIADQDLSIQMDPDVLAAFKASTHVSVQKGTSGFMMKASAQRRRTKEEIAEAKAEEAKKEQEIQDRIQYINQLEAALAEVRT